MCLCLFHSLYFVAVLFGISFTSELAVVVLLFIYSLNLYVRWSFLNCSTTTNYWYCHHILICASCMQIRQPLNIIMNIHVQYVYLLLPFIIIRVYIYWMPYRFVISISYTNHRIRQFTLIMILLLLLAVILIQYQYMFYHNIIYDDYYNMRYYHIY